ncbi:hypothetical protein JTB14_009737 [Gonioctena quinquepunctata]|nr:hypothetical protein JTB14_009737 [Gonioctena quinquepunctata]
MGSLGVSTVVLIFALSVTSALDSYDVIPSCARALFWYRYQQNYYDESLKSIYENEGVSNAQIMNQIMSKIYKDHIFDPLPFKKCVNKPSESTNEWFSTYGPCRDTYLTELYKERAQYYVTKYPTDGEKGVTKAVSVFENACSRDGSKPECFHLDQFKKCVKENFQPTLSSNHVLQQAPSSLTSSADCASASLQKARPSLIRKCSGGVHRHRDFSISRTNERRCRCKRSIHIHPRSVVLGRIHLATRALFRIVAFVRIWEIVGFPFTRLLVRKSEDWSRYQIQKSTSRCHSIPVKTLPAGYRSIKHSVQIKCPRT